jgi:RNA polymerase sigma factor (sigma-70 family)
VAWLGDPDWRDRFVRGDQSVIEEIYRTTFAEVRRAAGGVLREPADRNAVVHDVFLQLIASRELRQSYRGGRIGSWLGAIARHQSLDFVRRERWFTDLSAIDQAAAKTDLLDELRRELVRFAARMDPERRRLVQLRYIEGMTQVEAATALGMSRSTLEAWEHQFERALQVFLRGEKAVTVAR